MNKSEQQTIQKEIKGGEKENRERKKEIPVQMNKLMCIDDQQQRE